MIAMQYSFTLPADYDMGLIRHRIASKGHLLDTFPNLVFKAYLYADRADRVTAGFENLYAPFYVWRNSDGMNAFLASAGFVGLTRSFGWPSVQTWSVWQALGSGDVANAVTATRETLAVEPFSDLSALRSAEIERAGRDLSRAGALAAVAAYDPTAWSVVRFRLWEDEGPEPAAGRRRYRVGHVSRPGVDGLERAPLALDRPGPE
ncbi:DUF4865 family protein [Marinobacter halodurans]|uniref:DUF4865 family protein n=1 Tax=Marinobacter halodurans TaxID=2528979 RepID=A0ABY1ZJR4_9GAMM|nr:DUF4865 family protein [Marinobacter halodurans]TBW53329.1 DUF4865 family protein [Marinobacter halodurans]